MKIRTTINIRRELMDKLCVISKKKGIPVRDLLSSMLIEQRNDGNATYLAFSRVRYQERRRNAQWRRLHITLRGDEYEFCLDLRKVRKMSVSFLFAVAIEQYLDKLVEKYGKDMDKYCYHDYAIMKFDVEGIICWVIYWGMPRKILTP